MRKTYSVPTVSNNGAVVRETLGSVGSAGEINFQLPLTVGRMGYYL